MTGSATQGVRLLCERPSVLIKVDHLASGRDDAGAVIVAGPDWDERLRELLGLLTPGERSSVWAVHLGDDRALAFPAGELLDRARFSWYPEFVSAGTLVAQFQPVVDLATGEAHGREALVQGRLGAMTIRGEELVAAAEAHHAVFSFDARARAVALEAGAPALPEGERLFVHLEPRAVVDVPASVRAIFDVVARVGADPGRLVLDLVGAKRFEDQDLLGDLAAGLRERGAGIGMHELSGSADALRCLEALRPDVARLDHAVFAGSESSPARGRLVGAVVEIAHDGGSRVIADGIEHVGEFEALRELGVDYGQGFYFGQPAERMLPVDPRLVRRAAEAV